MKIVLTPDWFLGKDIIVEFFSFIVLFVFSFLSIKNYKLNKNRKSLYLGIGFGLIALANLASVFTKLVLYYDFGPSREIGEAIVTSQIVNSVDIFYYLGFLIQKLFTLLGLYVIYRLPRNKKSVGDAMLIIYFIILSAFLSEGLYFLFHLTALFILALIISDYYGLYKKNRYQNTKTLLVAFSLLAFSQLIFVMSEIDFIFVFGNIVELISYVILLTLAWRIQHNGKKKKQDGHHIRHPSNNTRKRR